MVRLGVIVAGAAALAACSTDDFEGMFEEPVPDGRQVLTTTCPQGSVRVELSIVSGTGYVSASNQTPKVVVVRVADRTNTIYNNMSVPAWSSNSVMLGMSPRDIYGHSVDCNSG